MSDCEVCDRLTNNPPISDSALQSTGILETEDLNGIVWLCDEHAEQLREWLRGNATIEPNHD